MKNPKQRVWSQGDVVLLEEKLPEDAVEVKSHDGVLAHGEVTGHRHRIVKGEVRFFRSEKGEYLQVLSDRAILSHEDHPNVSIGRGVTRYYQEREVDWMSEAVRNVAD